MFAVFPVARAVAAAERVVLRAVQGPRARYQAGPGLQGPAHSAHPVQTLQNDQPEPLFLLLVLLFVLIERGLGGREDH